MAYRTRRTRTRRSKKKHVFSKRAEKAIVRLAQKPVETKRHAVYTSWPSLIFQAGYVSGASASIRYNILSDLPRLRNSGTQTEGSFIGNKINLVGLRFEVSGMYIVTAVARPDIMFRFTVYSENNYYASVTGPGPASDIFDPDFNTTATLATWNMQVAKIHYRRTWKLGQASTGQSIVSKKFWVPLRRTVTTELEENVTQASYFGEAKGLQYYWVLEVYAPGETNLQSGLAGSVQFGLYFKDP